MALTIYPTDEYDSFCSLADAETLIAANIPSAQHTLWDALADSDKEILLRQSTILIKNSVTTLPATLEDDLKLACAYLANNSVGITMTDSNGKEGNVKVKEIVDVVKTEYFSAGKSNNSFPTIVNSLLSQYGVSTSSSFKFERS